MNVENGRREATVVVAMLTYRRLDCLSRVLPLLREQVTDITPTAQIVVIDNDPDATAGPVVAEWAERGVRYVHEPRPGIAAARNRALDEAGEADVLVFIDDDELPSRKWLTSLVERWREWGCAAISAPVVPDFQGRSVSAWIHASKVFDRRVRPTGSFTAGAATNNLLLDLHAIKALGVRFEEQLGLTGGEDTMFSHQLLHRGGQIRWCDEAEVVDPIPADRLTRRWVLRRTYRAGTSWSHMKLELAGSPTGRIRARADLLSRGVIRLFGGSIELAYGLLRSDVARQASGAMIVASHAGMLAGAVGLRFSEYARSPANL